MDQDKLRDIADWSRGVLLAENNENVEGNDANGIPKLAGPEDPPGVSERHVIPTIKTAQVSGRAEVPKPREKMKHGRDELANQELDDIDERERQARLHDRKMARRDLKAMRRPSPPPAPNSDPTSPPPKLSPHRPKKSSHNGQTSIVRNDEFEDLRDRKNRKRKPEVEAWELFEAKNVHNDKRRLTIPQSVRGKRGIFDRVISSETQDRRALRRLHRGEEEYEGDWRDAWKAQWELSGPGNSRRSYEEKGRMGPASRRHEEIRQSLRRSSDGTRSRSTSQRHVGGHRSLPNVLSPLPRNQAEAQTTQPAKAPRYSSSSWSTFRTNPTSSSHIIPLHDHQDQALMPPPSDRRLGHQDGSARPQSQQRGHVDLPPSDPPGPPYNFDHRNEIPAPAIPRSSAYLSRTEPVTRSPQIQQAPPQGFRYSAAPHTYSVFDQHHQPPFAAPLRLPASSTSRRTSLLSPEFSMSQHPTTYRPQIPNNPYVGISPYRPQSPIEHLANTSFARHLRDTATPSRTMAHQDPSRDSRDPDIPDPQALYDTAISFQFGRPPNVPPNPAPEATKSLPRTPQTYRNTTQEPPSNLPVHGYPAPMASYGLDSAQEYDQTPSQRPQQPQQSLLHHYAIPTTIEETLAQLDEILPSSSHRNQCQIRNRSQASRSSRRSRSEPFIPSSSRAKQYDRQSDQAPVSIYETPQSRVSYPNPSGFVANPRRPLHPRDIPYPDASTTYDPLDRSNAQEELDQQSPSEAILLASDEVAELEIQQYGTTRDDWGRLWSDARNDL